MSVTYKDEEWRQRHVEEDEMWFEPHAGVELRNVLQVGKVILNAIDVTNQDELGQTDEQIRPTSCIVIQQVQQITSTLQIIVQEKKTYWSAL